MEHIIYLDYGYNSSFMQKINLIKKYKFDGVFLFWKENLEEVVKELNNANLKIETIHLPFDNCNEIWNDSKEAIEYNNLIIKGIMDASKYNIKTVIFHISSKNPPEYNQIGLNRIKNFLAICEKEKINFALENLRRLDYLDYVYNNLKSSYLKFCFDSGHANAFTKNIESFPWEKYQNKLVCVHLHDNDGDYDLHKIPFEGSINWQLLMANLKKAKFKGPLTCEAVVKEPKISEEEYVSGIKQSLEKLETFF